MATSLMHEASAITITNTPTLDGLKQWWQARQADPDTALGYADDAPQNFIELMEHIHSGQYLFYLAHDAETVVGALWMHDIVRDADGTPRIGWMGTYVLPGHRGRHTTQLMWTLTHNALIERGVKSIYWASHHENTRSHSVAERHLGLTRMGLYPRFLLYGGVLTDCIIFSTYEKDVEQGWSVAKKRTERQLAPYKFAKEA